MPENRSYVTYKKNAIVCCNKYIELTVFGLVIIYTISYETATFTVLSRISIIIQSAVCNNLQVGE